ncbi:hypothetical protein [Reyranella sp.]|uniref:hypothetical protein n=1 Tax=Reyranella sp. TaxID=1929291 RepID=UPI003D09D443
MRDWLELSDLALAQKIDYTEKNGPETDPVLAGFAAVRAHLSMLAWNTYTEPLNCDSGPISRTGVVTFPMDEALGEEFMAAFAASPPAALQRDDFAIGYFSNRTQASCDHLNRANEYRAMTQEMTALLDRTMERLAPQIEQTLNHPFRIASARSFELKPRTGIEGRHLDGWPPSIRKLYFLPQGASRELGSTWFRCRDGRELTVESDRPLILLFENSVAWHAPRPAQKRRPTIELNIVPATKTVPQSYYAGLNGFYPLFPSEASFLQGTRAAAQIATARTERRGLLRRLIDR